MEDSALVLFSGGQDSTTCLAWALDRFTRVETIGFNYGQRHSIELECRKDVLDAIRDGFPRWAGRLGPDQLVDVPTLGAISETSLTRQAEFRMQQDGLPNSFVPGRNLVFLTFAAAVAYRRDLRRIVTGVCETDYSGYPDCRDDTMKAMQVALNLGLERRLVIETPLMWLDKAQHVGSRGEPGRAAADRDHPGKDPFLLRRRSLARARMGIWMRRVPRVRIAQGGLGKIPRRRHLLRLHLVGVEDRLGRAALRSLPRFLLAGLGGLRGKLALALGLLGPVGLAGGADLLAEQAQVFLRRHLALLDERAGGVAIHHRRLLSG